MIWIHSMGGWLNKTLGMNTSPFLTETYCRNEGSPLRRLCFFHTGCFHCPLVAKTIGNCMFNKDLLKNMNPEICLLKFVWLPPLNALNNKLFTALSAVGNTDQICFHIKVTSIVPEWIQRLGALPPLLPPPPPPPLSVSDIIIGFILLFHPHHYCV